MSTELFLAVDNNPQDVKAFESLIKASTAADDRDTLADVYKNVPRWAPDNAQNHMVRVLSQYARTATNTSLQSWLNYQNGLLFWQTYRDQQMAEMAFRKVESLPDGPEAADLLRRFYIDFYVAQNNWRRLEQVLTEPAKGGYEDKIEVARLLARLAEEKGQQDKAVGFWAQVRGDNPQDAESEAALRRLYAAVGKWNAMVDLLKEGLDRLDPRDIAEKTSIHLEMIDIYKNRMNAPAKVVASWQAILDIDPGNAQALDALAAEYTEMKRWPDLVKVLQQKVEYEEDTKKLVALHKQIASIMIERFSNAGEAIKSYEAILELEPDNREAIKILKDIYDQRRDYDSFVAISEREIGLVTDSGQRFKRLVELAKLASEKLRKPQTPIALWERVLETDPAHKEALTELENWFEREKNWERLSDILERRIALEKDVPAQVNLLDKLGMVASSRLGDPEKAADVWRQILSRDKEHRKAQTELKKKYLSERDWDGLEWFFRNYGDVNEWVRTLEQQVKSIEEPEERVTLLYKAAAVWKDELKDTRRAVKNLEAVIELEPRHADTARMLIPIYQELGSWKDLPNVYEIVLEASEDPLERKELLLQRAKVEEEKLGNVEGAFFAYVQAVSENPGATELHPKLRQLAEASANWESYVYVLQNSVDHIDADAARVEVLLEIGHVYRDKLGSDDTSLTFFNRVLALDPYNRGALDAAERAWEATGAVDQLVLCYQKRLATVVDSEERKATLFKLANVWRNAVQANDEAEAVLVEMNDDFPTDQRVHDALIEIYLEESRYPELRDVLERKRDVMSIDLTGAGAASDGASAPLMADIESQLGMLTYGTGDDPVAAAAAAIDRYEAALSFDPTHAITVVRLEELLAAEGERPRLTRLLAPVYERESQWGKLAQMLELQWVAAKDDDDQQAQVELLGRLGELYELRLDDKDLAWRTEARLFLLRPESGKVRSGLEALTAELGRWPQLVTLYSQECDSPPDKASRLAIKLEVARTWHKRLGDAGGDDKTARLEEARAFYQKVRDEEPEHKESIDALEEIYVDLDRSEDLLEIYRGQIDLSPEVDAKLDYLFRTVDLLRDRLGRPEDAIAPAEEALALAPGNLGAIQRLDELFTVTERWEDLASTLEDTIRLVASDKERVVVLKNRLALIYEQPLERPDTAIEIHASVLETDNDNEAAIDALERLFENADLAPSIAPILQPVYERRGDWQRLVDVYSVREEAATDVREKVDWHYRIAALYENEGQQPEMAFSQFEAAANLEPGSEQTLGELLRLTDTLDNHGELILFLQSIVEDIPSVERRIATHRTIALLARDKTHDLGGAEKQFRAILDIDAGDMPATDALIALYRDKQDDANLVEMLLRKAPMHGVAVADRNGLYAEAGRIAADTLKKPDQAIEVFETLHALDPNGTVGLDNLETLYERTEDWDNLVRIYREKIGRSDDVTHKKHFASLMGFVQAEKLESPDDAIATWHQILGWDPNDSDALVQLDALYSQQGDWFNLKETLRKVQELQLSSGVGQAGWADAQFRIAKLYENPEQLADVNAAIDAYGALLTKDPKHEGAVTSLETILAERDAYDRAFATLRPVLERGERFEELWQQFEVLAAHQVDEPEKHVESLHQMADLAEIRLVDARRALDAQARAFAIAPRNAHTIGELERLAEQNSFWEDLVGIYSRAAAAGDDDFLALELRLKAGAILMDRLGDKVRATDAYRAIAKDHPDHAEVQERLHRLYEERQMWPELAGILRAQAESEPEPARRIVYLEKLARVAESRLEDSQKAYEAYVEILELDRTSPLAIGELRRLFEAGVNSLDIADRLEPIYREHSRWDELDSLLQMKLSVIDDPNDQLQLMRDLALLALDKRGSEADALEWYGQAFQLDPDDDGLISEMERLAGAVSPSAAVAATRGHERLNYYTLAGAEIAAEDDRKVQLWHRASVVARDRLGLAPEAERILRKLLAVEPQNADALRALDNLLVQGERWADLEPVLVTQTTSDDIFDDERVVVWTRLAELYRDRLGRRDDAVQAWKEVLELQDMHELALRALREMYTDDERWPELFDVLQRLSDLSRDPEERVQHLSDMAQIAEQYLGQPARSIELWEDVLAARPNDIESVGELQRLLAAQGEAATSSEGRQKAYGALAEAYERELRMQVPLTKERRLEVYKGIGRLWQSELDDVFNAQGAWERARNEEPFDREALDALRGIHQGSGNDSARAEILDSALASEQYTPAEQLDLWRDLGEIRTDVFNDQPGAIEAWRAVLTLSPAAEPLAEGGSLTVTGQAIQNLEVLYENTQRWQDLVELYEKKLALIDDDNQRVETWLHVGTIQQDNLQNAAAAAATYRSILGANPKQLEASHRIEVIYEANGQWRELAQLLLARNNHLEPDEQLLNLQRLAQVHEQRLNEPDSAFIVLQNANEIAPDDTHVMTELERLAAVTGQWQDLYEVYEATLPSIEGDAKFELMLKSADVQRDKIGSKKEAIRLYERVLAEHSENEPALRALSELDEVEARWPELVAVLSTLADVTPNYDEKKELYQRIGRVHETRLSDLDAAVASWNQALDLDERDRVVLKELERLHIARRDWQALIDIYEKDAMLDPALEVERRVQIAGIYEQYIKDIDKAVAAFEDVLGIDPANETALERLEALYGEREDYDSLLDVYERAYNAARNDDDRLRMAKNAAILHGEKNDPRSAADAWNRVLRLKADEPEAFQSLVKIYTTESEWDDLIKLYELRYETADGASERADALSSMASIYRTQLDDVDNAIAMYERVLLERRGDPVALDALDELLAHQGQWEQVIENLEKKLETETDIAKRVALLCRQGLVASNELDDNYRSAASYTRVLKEDPGNATAVEELLRIYREDERWDKAVETLNHKLTHATSRNERAAVHVDLAEIMSEKLGQEDQALAHFEEAERADPESRRALQVLADHYMKTGAYEKAMTRLEALVDKLDPEVDKAIVAQTHKKTGLCAEALYLDDQAIDELNLSAQLVPPDLETVRALGRIHYKKGNYHEAERFLQEVLDKYKKDLTSDDQVKVLMQLGESALKVKNIAKAQLYLKQVVESQPQNPQALESIIEVLRQYGEWNEAVRFQERLLGLRSDKHEQYKILLAMGDTYVQELKDRRRGAEAYRKALDLDVYPKAPALKLVELCLQSNEFEDAIRNLKKLVQLEDEPKRKAQFAYMAGVVYRDNLNDAAEAVKYFNLSLDHNLDNLQAFRTIDELVTKARDWKALDQNYRRMIQRVREAGQNLPGRDQILFKLYEGLGEIYRSRLKDNGKSIASFELARETKPDEGRIREILASLYEGAEDSVDKAIKEHRWLIAQQANRYDSYRKLVELFKKARQYDAAWCIAGLLTALRQANPEESQFYQRYLRGTMAEPNRVIDQALWMQCVMSRQEDPEVGRVIEIVYAALGKARISKPDKDYQLKKKSRLELNEGLLVTNTIAKVLRMFGMPAPEMYRGELATGIEFLQTDPPKLRFGTDVLSGVTDKELAFHVARRMTYFMPSHLVAILYPREALEGLYLGAASVVDPNYQITTRDDVDPSAKAMLLQAAGETRGVLEKQLTPELRQQLTAVMRSLWKRTPVPELGIWHRAIELTAIHAGVVASNDPALALELLQRESTGMSKLTKQEKLRDHVLYVMSDAYLQLRKQLGLQIDYSDLMA